VAFAISSVACLQSQIVACTEYTYDPANQITGIFHYQGTTPKQWEEYSYDAIGRRINTEYNGTSTFDLYNYDDIGQVKQVHYNSQSPLSPVTPIKTQSWTYDPVGNRITTTDTQAGNSTYQVLAGNKYGTVMHNNVGGGLSYDARGNMTTDGSGWAYTYDAKNRLIEARNHIMSPLATYRYEFVYDGLNRRVIERTHWRPTNTIPWFPPTAKYRYYDGWNLVEVHEPTSTNTPTRLVEAYVHGPRVDETLRYRRYQYDSNGNVISSGSYYLQENALGSTVRILDAQNGNGILRVRYDVFGKASFASEGTPNNYFYYNSVFLRFLYTGREMLGSAGGIGSGLMDYRNRIYTTTLGRFLQTDPIRFAAGDVNLYRYVGNNPTNFRDPWGLWAFGWGDAWDYYNQLKDPSDGRFDGPNEDKLAHCMAHCEIVKQQPFNLGYLDSYLLDIGKEAMDAIAGLWKEGSSWDDEDRKANQKGRDCASDPRGCECCCKDP
jgi:RHS repeat-associated protein